MWPSFKVLYPRKRLYSRSRHLQFDQINYQLSLCMIWLLVTHQVYKSDFRGRWKNGFWHTIWLFNVSSGASFGSTLKNHQIFQKNKYEKKNSSTRFGQFKVPQASGMTNPSLINGYASKVLVVVVIGRQ